VTQKLTLVILIALSLTLGCKSYVQIVAPVNVPINSSDVDPDGGQAPAEVVKLPEFKKKQTQPLVHEIVFQSENLPPKSESILLGGFMIGFGEMIVSEDDPLFQQLMHPVSSQAPVINDLQGPF